MTLLVMHKDTKPFLLGALAGAVIAVWTGFDALGWKTSSANESLVKRGADSAVVAAYARVCSAQFKNLKDFEARLATLQKAERYSRGDIVNKAGYATMVGEKEATQGVAQACADLLIPEKTG
ncbi:MAG: hypothetical protein EXR28_13430 [Betaproteobacteria bacterium]|nr:hypothetical protein [Betaproteobacteria bacterium]